MTWQAPSMADHLGGLSRADEAKRLKVRHSSPTRQMANEEPPDLAQCEACEAWRPTCAVCLGLDAIGQRKMLCDGCRSGLMRGGQDPSVVLSAIGAPPEKVANARALFARTRQGKALERGKGRKADEGPDAIIG